MFFGAVQDVQKPRHTLDVAPLYWGIRLAVLALGEGRIEAAVVPNPVVVGGCVNRMPGRALREHRSHVFERNLAERRHLRRRRQLMTVDNRQVVFGRHLINALLGHLHEARPA